MSSFIFFFWLVKKTFAHWNYFPIFFCFLSLSKKIKQLQALSSRITKMDNWIYTYAPKVT